MTQESKYIYGIITLDGKKEFAPIEIGDQEERVYTISYRNISAAVSDSEIVDYTHMPKDAVARYLLRHQKVIEGIMPKHTIIPMRLGTFASDEKEVRGILNRGYKIIKDILREISEKIEIDVVATWSDFNSVLKEIGEEKEIKEFKERFLANPKGITIEDQMKVGVMVKKALDRKREKYAFQIENALKTICQDLREHELMDDKMIINTAFLIDKARQEDFDRKIEEINNRFAEKLNFRCVGPLPPYSFSTLEIKKMQFEEIDWARKRLGLNNYITSDEIKEAYRSLVISTHPDKNPDTPGMENEFDEVTRAHKIIVDYCRVWKQTGQNEKCSLKEKEFKKNAILVKVRG